MGEAWKNGGKGGKKSDWEGGKVEGRKEVVEGCKGGKDSEQEGRIEGRRMGGRKRERRGNGRREV